MAELSKKLGIKPGQRLLIMNAPDGYLQTLGVDGAEVKTQPDTTKPDGTFDFVQLFVKSKAEVDGQAATAIKAVKPGGLVWIAFPKKSSKIKTDISRDTGWESIHQAGWEGVTLISVDDVWSAFRIRPLSEIKSRGK
jgi:hypothetical protein